MMETKEAKPKPPVGTRKELRGRGGWPCKRCSKYLLPHEPMEYSLAGWVHATVEACAAAPPANKELTWATDEERDSQPFYQRLQRLAVIAHGQPWTTASTMPDKPHQWMTRWKWYGDGFDELTMATRTMGYTAKFGSTKYNLLNINEHRYWSMEPRYAPPQTSELINRGVRLRYEPEPEPWFGAEWEWWRDEIEKFVIGKMTPQTARVLDVGGTCWNVATVVGTGYRAIGTPQDMARILHQVPTARIMHVEIEHFAPINPEPFDMAIVGFGGGAQLTARDIKRLRYMTRGPVVIQIGVKVETSEAVSALLQSGEESRIGSMKCYVLEGQWQEPS